MLQLTNTSGQVTKDYTYDAFGSEVMPVAGDVNPFRYAGEYTDAETGYQYLRARYYDANVGRFLTEDPIKDGSNWYIYANNPILYIDPLGLAPTTMEAALMADKVYNLSDRDAKNDRIIYIDGKNTGWRLIDVEKGREGMKMGIYVKTDASHEWNNPLEYALVFKGSSTLDNWKNNAEQFFSSKSADMWDAINAGKYFSDTHSKYEITFVGHSKGGAEAASAAVATAYRNAILFNPAISNLSDYGLSAKNYTGNMQIYIVEGEILHTMQGWFSGPPIGKNSEIVYLPQQHKFKWSDTTPGRVNKRIQNHLMPAVISALKEAGY